MRSARNASGDTLRLAQNEEEVAERSETVDGKQEEHWHFSEDSYTLGVIALARDGLPKALPAVSIAFIAPVIQCVASNMIFARVVGGKGHSDGHDFAGVEKAIVTTVCFFLLGLKLSNEILESYHKLVFCMRGAAGRYVGTDTSRFVVGIALSFCQFILASFTVGICLAVVGQSTDIVNAFMNYVAFSFITEVDDVLLASRSLQYFACLDSPSITMSVQGEHDKDIAGSWPLHMVVCFNVLVFGYALPFCLFTLEIVAMQAGYTHLFHLQEVPAVAAFAVIMNLFHYFGGKLVNAADLSIGVASFNMCWSSALLVRKLMGGESIMPQMLENLLFLVSAALPATAVAAQPNPLCYLSCPIRLPLLVWLQLVMCGCWVAALHADMTN